MNTPTKSESPKSTASKLTPDEAQAVRGVIEAVREMQSPITLLEQKKQKQSSLQAELSSNLLQMQAVADPYNESNIERAVVAELVTTRRLGLLDKLQTETDSELRAAEQYLRYWASERSKPLATVLIRLAANRQTDRREKLIDAYPTASAEQIDRLLTTHEATANEAAFINRVSRGGTTPEDALRLAELLLQGASSPFNFQFSPTDGFNNSDWQRQYLDNKS